MRGLAAAHHLLRLCYHLLETLDELVIVRVCGGRGLDDVPQEHTLHPPDRQLQQLRQAVVVLATLGQVVHLDGGGDQVHLPLRLRAPLQGLDRGGEVVHEAGVDLALLHELGHDAAQGRVLAVRHGGLHQSCQQCLTRPQLFIFTLTSYYTCAQPLIFIPIKNEE